MEMEEEEEREVQADLCRYIFLLILQYVNIFEKQKTHTGATGIINNHGSCHFYTSSGCGKKFSMYPLAKRGRGKKRISVSRVIEIAAN